MKKLNLQEYYRWLPQRSVLVAWFAVVGMFSWTYWSSIRALYYAWKQPEYGHGYFVPLFALYLLWHRRKMFSESSAWRGSLWGLTFIAIWVAMRCAAIYLNFGWLPEASLLPFVIGLTLFVGGWRALHWAWPAIAFLVFMIPLPGPIQGSLSQPLQRIGTEASVYVIQTLGIASVPEGNVIKLTLTAAEGIIEKKLGVVEACSGLRMLMLFFAICFGAALVVKKPLWERLVIVASAVPIAILSNVVRISLTAILCWAACHWPSVISQEQADEFFHGMAGLLMMPVALLILWMEMALISKLMIAPLPERPLVLESRLVGEVRGPGLVHVPGPERRKQRG